MGYNLASLFSLVEFGCIDSNKYEAWLTSAVVEFASSISEVALRDKQAGAFSEITNKTGLF